MSKLYRRKYLYPAAAGVVAGVAVALGTGAAISSGGLKYNAWNYLVLNTDHDSLDQAAVNGILAGIDTYACATTSPNRTLRTRVDGITIKIRMRDLARSIGNVSYSTPFIQQILDRCNSFVGRKPCLRIVGHDRRFGDSMDNVTGAPYYASDCPFYSTFPGDGGYNGDWGNGLSSIIQIDTAGGIEWNCRLSEALAVQWDSHPLVMGYSVEGESATPEPHVLQSYEQLGASNYGAVHNGLKTWNQRSRAAWVTTPLKTWVNHYYDNTSFAGSSKNPGGTSYPWTIDDLAANQATYNIMAGSPDPELPVPITSVEPTGMGGPGGGQYIGIAEVWRGRLQRNGTYFAGGIDRRDTIGYSGSIEGYGYNIGDGGYSFSASAIGNQYLTVMHARFIDWSVVRTGQPAYEATQDIFTGVLPYLASGGGAPYSITKPSNWP